MPTSDLTIINFKQEWIVGPDVTFNSGFEADSNEPFFSAVTLEAERPFTERLRETIQPTAVSGVEGPIVYGGNYKPVLQDIEIVEVASQDLDATQLQVIRQNLTVNVSPDPGGPDVFLLNITPIALAGAQFFELKIPYEETDIVNNSPDLTIPFLQFTGTDALPTETVIGLSQSNNELTVYAGNETINELVLEINDITAGTRTFTSKTAEVTATDLDINWAEDINGQTLLLMDNPGDIFPQFLQATSLGSNTIGVNYRYAMTINPSLDTVFASVEKEVSGVEGGSFETSSTGVGLFSICVGPGILVSVNKGSQGAAGMLTVTVIRESLPTVANFRRSLPVIAFKNNHSFNQALSVTCGTSTIELSSTKDATGTIANATATVDADMTVVEVVAALNDAIATVPEWVPWFEAVVFEGEWQAVAGSLLYINDLAINAKYGNNTTGILDGIRHGAYIIPDNGGNIPTRLPQVPTQYALPLEVEVGTGLPIYSESYDASDLSITIKDVFDDLVTNLPAGFFRFYQGTTFASVAFNNIDFTTFVDTPIEYYENLPIAAINDGTVTVSGKNGGANVIHLQWIKFDHTFETASGSYNYSVATDTMSTVAAALEADADFVSVGASIEAGLLLGDAPVGLIDRTENITVNSMLAPFVLTVKGEPGQSISASSAFSLTGKTINELISEFNVDADIGGAFEAVLLNSTRGSALATALIEAGPLDIDEPPSSPAKFVGSFTRPRFSQYDLSTFPTLASLATRINSDWGGDGLSVLVRSETNPFPDAISANLLEVIPAVSIYDTVVVFNGVVKEVATPEAPREDVTLSFNIKFAAGGVPFEETGIQVALGGYESEGTFFPNNAPNSFFEPGYNTLFPITFSVVDADTIYLLVRTRKNLDGTIYLSEVNDYAGRITYTNGSRGEQASPFIPTEPQFVDAWEETNLGDPPTDQVPVVIAFDSGKSSLIDVYLEDILEDDSINIQVINAPEVLDDFAFLAVNRSNLAGSMTESQQGRVFGLVLDNRGVWDVLIGPEAILRETDTGGVFTWLSEEYTRELIDDDEAYDFEFNNPAGLPSEVRNAISLIPVPGYPQVWTLRIEKGVKDYLRAQRTGANRNSTTGCSVDIDILVTGRFTGVQGICRVTIFFDVYCVFDTGLCDVFWNLINPPEPSGPDLIENTLAFSYQSLTDCNNLTQDADGDNTEINAPVLVNVTGVPVFENGNGLLLLKSYYSAEVQGFYFPRGEDLTGVQYEDCSSIGDNLQLATRLNTPAIYLPDAPDQPITDPFEIAAQLETADSYMYVKPAFQFPSSDPQRDCGAEEIVIIGVGYQFKNWTASSGTRSDDIMFGVNLVLPGGVFASPDLDLCYRYYYNREES